MKINLKSILDRKDLRGLECRWSSLNNINDYFIPTSLDDLKESEFNEIKIQNTTYFFRKRIQDNLRAFVSIIYNNPLINDQLCYDSIYKSVIREIAESFNSQIKRKFDSIINSMSVDLSSKIDNHLFYFPLNGFDLVGIKKFSISDVTLESFDENNLKEILVRLNATHENKQFTDAVQKCISDNFIGRSTLIIPSYGDREKAEQIAREKSKFVVNYFRFITCLLVHERIDEDLVKISIESAWPRKNDQFFCEIQEKNELFLADDRGRRPVQSFEFRNERLSELKEKGYFDDLGEFVFKKEKTEIEMSILTAIYWIGEAQNDYDRASAFLKYWTALESIFTNPNERKSNSEQASKVTHTLCKSVSIILAFSDYNFIEVTEIKTTYRKLDKLYDARSNIVHNGSYGKISIQEVSDICRFASWTVLILFCLRKYNHISSISEIRTDLDNLYDEIKK